MKKHKYLFTIAYDGSSYFGLVKQPNKKTILGELENSFERIFKEKIIITPAGRTDAGVHAYGQKISLESVIDNINIISKWKKSTCKSIMILDCKKIENKEFHVRFSVKNKVYLYKLMDKDFICPFNYRYFTEINMKEFSLKKFKNTINIFCGKHDFTSVSTREERVNPVREIKKIKIEMNETEYKNKFMEIEFEGKSFLRHMIRRIVGTSIAVATNKISFDKVVNAFNNKIILKYKASPNGLYLKRIDY